MQGVVAHATHKGVVSGTAGQGVVACIARQVIIACSAVQQVGSNIAIDAVIAGAAGHVFDRGQGVGFAAQARGGGGHRGGAIRHRGCAQVDHHIGGATGVAGRVGACAALQGVVAGTAVKRVVARIALDQVGTRVAGQDIVARTAPDVFDRHQRVCVVAAVGGCVGTQIDSDPCVLGAVVRRVQASAAVEGVVASAAAQLVIARLAQQGVVADATNQGVGINAGTDGVVARTTIEHVVAVVADDAVVAAAADHVFDVGERVNAPIGARRTAAARCTQGNGQVIGRPRVAGRINAGTTVQ